MAAAWCDVGLQPTWQEIELSSSLLALLFMAARCEDGCAANVAGATRVLAISSLCFSWLAPRVPARPTWSWSRFRELLDFVPHGRLSRSSQRGRRIEPLGTLLPGYPASNSSQRGAGDRAIGQSPRFVSHGCLGTGTKPTWSETDFLTSSALLFLASSFWVVVSVHDHGSPFFSCRALCIPLSPSATIPPSGFLTPSPPPPGQFDNIAPQWLPGPSSLLFRVGSCAFCFLFPSLFAPNSQLMC